MKKRKSYRDLIQISDFYDRFEYLNLEGSVGEATFGFERYLNQTFYRSDEWKNCRNDIIIRDNGMDLGLDGYPISGRILVHHIEPIFPEDIRNRSSKLLDHDNLVCVSLNTHEAIHYGDRSLLPEIFVERTPGDTTLW